MSKAKMLGYNKPFLSNSRADMRRSKAWQRSREYTDKHEAVCAEKRERRQAEEMKRQKEAAYG